jgi:hypothetical protein
MPMMAIARRRFQLRLVCCFKRVDEKHIFAPAVDRMRAGCLSFRMFGDRLALMAKRSQRASGDCKAAPVA